MRVFYFVIVGLVAFAVGSQGAQDGLRGSMGKGFTDAATIIQAVVPTFVDLGTGGATASIITSPNGSTCTPTRKGCSCTVSNEL